MPKRSITSKWASDRQREHIRQLVGTGLMFTDITRGGAQRLIEKGDVLKTQLSQMIKELAAPPFKIHHYPLMIVGDDDGLTREELVVRHGNMPSSLPREFLDPVGLVRKRHLYHLIQFTSLPSAKELPGLLRSEGFLPVNFRELLLFLRNHLYERPTTVTTTGEIIAFEEQMVRKPSMDPWVPSAQYVWSPWSVSFAARHWPDLAGVQNCFMLVRTMG